MVITFLIMSGFLALGTFHFAIFEQTEKGKPKRYLSFAVMMLSFFAAIAKAIHLAIIPLL